MGSSDEGENEGWTAEQMPRFEEWTRQELQNENEILGFEDGSDVSDEGLIRRATEAWKDAAREIALRNRVDVGFASDPRLSFGSEKGGQVGLSEICWSGVGDDSSLLLLDPTRELAWTRKDPQADVENSTASSDKLNDTGQKRRGAEVSLQIASSSEDETDLAAPQPARPPMPDYSSFSKTELELEYHTLHSLKQPDPELASPPPTLPKTKLAIVGRVVKLWQSIYHPEALSQKKSAVPKKKKLSEDEIDQLLERVCMEEPDFYMSLLRYEPFKLSVFEDKVAIALEIEHAKPIASLVLTKWLDWQALSYYTLDPTVSRKRH
ncbi:hypothetical protein CROQUDRAFT_307697 [Cronartium quercuum f. sp. fusiforme G11]|uniref:Uncharacterized protein n=1 Tax=Cronartium quercuum f. sp. fusiforme G11 TaxID=708437 RepID=A0A9P6N773_9BASI|nr:hypothetical protein CROQUDRAFT_307697 [Cronartium quercuum f. sp. fusiforme G11]